MKTLIIKQISNSKQMSLWPNTPISIIDAITENENNGIQSFSETYSIIMSVIRKQQQKPMKIN